MSDETTVKTQTTEDPQVKNPSTEAEDKNVPYDRFQEVVQSKNDMATMNGKLQAQIDKMNQTSKDKKQVELVEQGKLKEALDIMTKERDTYKIGSDEWDGFKVDKRESLMKQITNDKQRSIAEGLSDMIKLEDYVNEVTYVNAPSTSQARATSGKAGEFGGYESAMEWVTKDPKGYEKAKNNAGGDKFGDIFAPNPNPFPK